MPITILSKIEDLRLWRYISLAKLLSLMQENCLYFTKLGRFRDPYEGMAPIAVGWAAKVDEVPVFQSARDDQIKDQLYVNCWHGNPDESAAMSAEYFRTPETWR